MNLSEEEVKKRKVELIDIAKCERDPRKVNSLNWLALRHPHSTHLVQYRPEEDPTTFKSKKTGRGPLTDPDWIVRYK